MNGHRCLAALGGLAVFLWLVVLGWVVPNVQLPMISAGVRTQNPPTPLPSIYLPYVANERGQFSIVHPSPIFQDITRAAFLQSSQGHDSVHFSTLESYHRNLDGDRFLLVSHEIASGHLITQTVIGSIEARSYAYSQTLNRYVLGTSLDAQLLLYDPENHTVERVFRDPRWTAWIHGLAVKDDYAYTILSIASSAVGSPMTGFGGILRVSLRTGRWEVIPYDGDRMEQAWGGVQTIDPTGRIWFYRAYPFRSMWYDPERGMRDRVFAGYESWNVESWDLWKGYAYVVLTNSQGEFIKKRVDLGSLEILEDLEEPISNSTRLFLESMRVDLYRTEDTSNGILYFHPKIDSFYRRDPAMDTFSYLGRINLGELQIMGVHQSPQERSMLWIHPTFGELGVLGTLPNDDLIIWLQGRKTYGVANFPDGTLLLSKISVSNISPANITSLAIGSDGFIYGGGYLTMSNMFRFDPATKAVQLLEGAIPNAEGQINSMFTGLDGKIYGAGHPNSVLFRYDPLAVWNPGSTSANNPVNLGPMGHAQQRSRRGVQALDGTVWYQSASDYSDQTVHALARADFVNLTLTVKTDVDDGFPQVEELAVLDNEHLILLGKKGSKAGLYVLDQPNFQIESERELPNVGGVLVNLDPRDLTHSRLFLAQDKGLYRVGSDLSLQFVHESPKAIVRILAGTGEDIILVGKTHIEKINLVSGSREIWWNGTDAPGGYVFRYLDWSPVVFYQGTLFIADEEKLLRFNR